MLTDTGYFQNHFSLSNLLTKAYIHSQQIPKKKKKTSSNSAIIWYDPNTCAHISQADKWAGTWDPSQKCLHLDKKSLAATEYKGLKLTLQRPGAVGANYEQ